MKFWIIFSVVFTFAFSGCSNKQMRNFNAIPPFSANFVNAVIEIPAGTNRDIKYNEEKKMFLSASGERLPGVIDFLPLPGNYGFVPGTYIDPVMGGDGNPVDILVISESLPTGTIIEVIPLLIFYFEKESGFGTIITDPKIIATPAEEKSRIIQARDYENLFENYPDLVDILIKWFSNYEGQGKMVLKALGDGDMALGEISKWNIRSF